MFVEGTVIGVDLNSNKLAFCAVHHNQIKVGISNLGKPWSPASSYAAYKATNHFLAGLPWRDESWLSKKPLVAFVEAAVVAGSMNIQSTIKQAYVSGGVQASLQEWGYSVILPAVATWKKGMGAGGNATKEKVASTLETVWREAYQLCGRDEDLIDACGIAYHSIQVSRLSTRMERRG